MKSFLLFLFLSFCIPVFVFAQATVNFETNGNDWNWIPFDGTKANLDVVANPSKVGNTTDSCAMLQITDITADPWLGVFSPDLPDFTIDANNCYVSIWVYKDHISNVGLKLEPHGIHSKIVRRHPHVFDDVELDGVDGVLANWEKLKEKERKDKKQEKGLLDGVPVALPALEQAQEYQDRAARVGFDWPEIEGVLDKIAEEITEVKNATNEQELTSELGDLLFALVNLARWKKVDSESALRGTNMKFKKRFAYVEQGAKKRNRNLSDLSLEEMDSLWNEAKHQGL